MHKNRNYIFNCRVCRLDQGLEPWGENALNPRGIPPSVIQAEIAQPGSTNVYVFLNKKGHVKTVIPGGS